MIFDMSRICVSSRNLTWYSRTCKLSLSIQENKLESTFVTDAVPMGGKELDESAFFEERLKSAIGGARTTATVLTDTTVKA